MSAVRLVLPEPAGPAFEALRRELGVVEQFPAAALAEAEQAARSPRLPGLDLTARASCDAPDLPLGATLDVVLAHADPVRRTVLFRPA